MTHCELNRRELLRTGATTIAAVATGALSFPIETRAADPYRGFKMAMQSYTLREFKVQEALDISSKLGLKYWDSFPRHLPISSVPKVIAEQKALLTASDIRLLAFGVVAFDDTESKAREVFDFAKAIGIETINADPKNEAPTFQLLDKLVDEYQINIAIHNHGPKSRWNKIDDVVNAIQDHHPRIGACVDTGHYLRSSENPVEAIERLKGRVFGVHLKDVKGTNVFTILGDGDLDVVGCLRALQAQKYQHCLALEYEENPQNPVPDIEICLQKLRAAMEKLD